MSRRSPTLMFIKIRAESGYHDTRGVLRFMSAFDG